MKETRAESWAHLVEELYRGAWDASIGRFRSPYVFRGVPDVAHDLSTSLVRLAAHEIQVEPPPSERRQQISKLTNPSGQQPAVHQDRRELSRLEGHLLRNFRKYAHNHVSNTDSIWGWLSLAQHHGLPTRMLDWTYSPFVALHFVTTEPSYFDQDGAIWCVDHCRTNDLLPKRLRQEADREGSNVFTVEMLQRCVDTLEDLAQLSKKDFVIFLEPPSLDARIINQYALFSLMSRPESVLHEWLVAHKKLARKIIIPASIKGQVRDALDQANITERVPFPGLDGLARWLTRYYRPSPQHRREIINPLK